MLIESVVRSRERSPEKVALYHWREARTKAHSLDRTLIKENLLNLMTADPCPPGGTGREFVVRLKRMIWYPMFNGQAT